MKDPVCPWLGRLRRVSPRLRLIAEAEFHRDLVVRDTAVLDVAAQLGDLEPIEVADRLARHSNGLVDGVFDALVGGADNLADRIDVVHGASPGPAWFGTSPRRPLTRALHAGFLCRG